MLQPWKHLWYITFESDLCKDSDFVPAVVCLAYLSTTVADILKTGLGNAVSNNAINSQLFVAGYVPVQLSSLRYLLSPLLLLCLVIL